MSQVSQADIRAIRESGFFDEYWYVENYPDVGILGIDPAEHYLWLGHVLRRQPSPKFDAAAYLDFHVDVARSGINPLLHYAKWGKAERRDTWGWRGYRDSGKADFIRANNVVIRRSYADFDTKREREFLRFVERANASTDVFEKASVSIVMPTFNRATEIRSAIDSVLMQSHKNWELIIVDDGSTDDTALVVKPYLSDKRIQYIQTDHIGVSGARNRGLLSGNGRYVAYLDSDNSWEPHFLRNMIVFMGSQELDAAYSGIRSLDDCGNVSCYRGDVFVWSACKQANYVDLNPFMHRRELAISQDKQLLFDTNLRRVVDWDFILRLTAEARISYAPFIGVNYYDGAAGNRITKTEYQNGEMPLIIETVRKKHSHRRPAHDNFDTGAGARLSTTSEQTDASCNDLKVRFFPDYRTNNAYQPLLYSHGAFKDDAIRPGTIDDCLRLVTGRRDDELSPVVFHLHWLNPLVSPATDATEAALFVDIFVAKLRLFVSLGGSVVWTVHNVVSHEPKYLDQEIRLSKAVAELADWIHVHHASVIEATKPHYELPPEKILVAEHGNYIGSLPDTVTRADARRQLGIPVDATVLVFLGQLRGYKGIDELVEAFRQICRERNDCWLVLAGKVLGIDQEELRTTLSNVPNTVFRPGYVRDDQMQVYLRSGDAMVLPYKKVLTSGSVFLAMSFGLPVICPRAGLLEHVVRDGHNGVTYDPEAADGLTVAVRRFLGFRNQQMRLLGEQALQTAQQFRWQDTATKIRRHIEGLHFGRRVSTELAGSRRAWFVRGEVDSLRGARCVAIILHYQNIDDTRNCVESVLAQSPEVRVVVISNSETIDDIRSLSKSFPQVVAVQSEDNIGYAAANNFGLWICRHVRPEFFWVLNPDVDLPPNYYRELVEKAREWPSHSFFGTTIVAAHEPERVLFCGGEVRVEHGAKPGHIHMGSRVADLPQQPFECDYLTGTNIFGRADELAAIGYMPEDYFLYFEETDWFLNYHLRNGGKRPLVFPDLLLKNLKRSEAGHLPSRYYLYYFVRNALVFGKKYASGPLASCEEETRKFADAWLEKIKARAPARLAEFRELVERAFKDGLIGLSGRVSL
jgi:GT2 family glycosyltransferase/glycosyltransferase involved in cell wall biosynthesis